MTDAIPEGYIPLGAACKRYNLNYAQLYALYRRGIIRGYLGETCVLLEVASLEEWLPPPGWAWAFDALKEYPLRSHHLHALINKGAVRARRSGVRYQVELASLERAIKALAEKSQIPPGYITVQEAAKRLGVAGNTAWQLVRKGSLRGHRHGWRVLVEEASLEELRPPGLISLKEAEGRTGRAVATIYAWARQGRVHARKGGEGWIVEEQSLQEVDRSAPRRTRGPRAKGTKPRPEKQELPRLGHRRGGCVQAGAIGLGGAEPDPERAAPGAPGRAQMAGRGGGPRRAGAPAGLDQSTTGRRAHGSLALDPAQADPGRQVPGAQGGREVDRGGGGGGGVGEE